MLAGAHGIDLVLFTVAADDGVMPQTEEHFDIVHLLGVSRAVFVITKTDLAPDGRVAEVADEIRILAAGTALEGSPIVPCSCVTGRGLDQLREEIERALHTIDTPAPRGYFRLPVDRVFILQGHGVVATGTALAGTVRTGDRVRRLPGGEMFRVRSVQVHNEAVDEATWGQRVALNLTGPETAALGRGDVLCHEQITSSSDRFDASLEARAPGGPSPALKNHQRVRIHLGTAERQAKLILLGGRDRVEPRQTAFCQIVLSEPLLALRGDRFIVRDETSQRTLGGGVVLHPWPRVHRRREAGLDDDLRTLQTGSPAALMALFIDGHDGFAVPVAPLARFLNCTEDDVLAAVPHADGIRIVPVDGEQVYTTQKKWDGLTRSLLDAVREFHAGHPLAPGRDMEALRDDLPGRVPPKVFRALVAELEAGNAVVRDGSVLRLPEHAVALGDGERGVAARITQRLGEHPLTPPDLPQLEAAVGSGHATFVDVLRVLERQGVVVRVSAELYFLADSLAGVKRTVRDEFKADGTLTPASFRDRFGTSRKYTIPLLEYLDREGVTIRTGEIRRLRAHDKIT